MMSSELQKEIDKTVQKHRESQRKWEYLVCIIFGMVCMTGLTNYGASSYNHKYIESI